MFGWPGGFDPTKLTVKRHSNSFRDLVLKREQITRRMVEPLGPEMGVGLRID